MTNELPDGCRVVGYARDSGGARQELSITQQKERIGEWCIEKGLVLSRIFEDSAKSGSSTAGRHQFLQMIDYFSSGKVPERGVILWEFARLSRDYDDLMYFVSDLKRQGYAVVSISDAVPEGLEGNLLLGIKAYSNAKFLMDLRRNVRRGLHYVVRSQHANIARPPVGYKAINVTVGKHRDNSPHIIKRLEIDEHTAPIIRQMFEMRAHGATLKEIHEKFHLYDWYVNYNRLFRNSLYIGIKQYGDETIPDFCPPIIDLPLWNEVQRIMDERKSRRGTNHPRTVRSRYWLTGLLYCGNCGMPLHSRLTINRNKVQHDYYYCGSHLKLKTCGTKMIPREEIHAIVMQKITEVLNNKDIIDRVYEEAQAQESALYASRDTERQVMVDKVKELDGSINRLLSAIKDIGHSRAMLDDLQRLEGEKLQLEQSIANIEMPVIETIHLSRDELEQNFTQILNSANEIERGQIVRDIVQRVEAVKNNGVITGKIWMSIVSPGDISLSL